MPHVLCQVQKSITPKLRELLAIVYGCERFNMYTYVAEIEVLSGHKALESIFKKPLFKVPPPLQRMRLCLQKYNLKLRYVPGTFFILQIPFQEHLISPMFLLTMICIATWSISFIV